SLGRHLLKSRWIRYEAALRTGSIYSIYADFPQVNGLACGPAKDPFKVLYLFESVNRTSSFSRPASIRPGRPPEGCPRIQSVACASFLLTAFPAACASG